MAAGGLVVAGGDVTRELARTEGTAVGLAVTDTCGDGVARRVRARGAPINPAGRAALDVDGNPFSRSCSGSSDCA